MTYKVLADGKELCLVQLADSTKCIVCLLLLLRVILAFLILFPFACACLPSVFVRNDRHRVYTSTYVMDHMHAGWRPGGIWAAARQGRPA